MLAAPTPAPRLPAPRAGIIAPASLASASSRAFIGSSSLRRRLVLRAAPTRPRLTPRESTTSAGWPGLADADNDAKKTPNGSGGREPRGGGRRGRGGGRGGSSKSAKAGGGGGGGGGGRGRARAGGRGRARPAAPPPASAGGVVDPSSAIPDDGSRGWRLFDLTLDLASDPGKDSFEPVDALRDAACEALGLPTDRRREDGAHLLKDGPGYGLRIVRKSCDARKKGAPVFKYVVDVDDACVNSATVAMGMIKPLRIAAKPKRRERAPPPELEEPELEDEVGVFERDASETNDAEFEDGVGAHRSSEPGEPSRERSVPRVLNTSSTCDTHPVVIVGLGPAGLFAALALAESGVPVVVLERGQPVESRGRDIGALFARRVLNRDSNLCFGEGGAGTWSDGKLTTRIGRNSEDVRSVLGALVAFGAPPEILVSGKPHLGTDRLVKILRNAREHLMASGVDVRFGETATRVEFERVIDREEEGGEEETRREDEDEDAATKKKKKKKRTLRATGVWTRANRDPSAGTRSSNARDASEASAASERFEAASAVVFSAGHSARDLLESLHAEGVELSFQSFAAGFRIEHPQALLDRMQYGDELAPLASRGKGPLPVADYRLAHQSEEAEDAEENVSEAAAAAANPSSAGGNARGGKRSKERSTKQRSTRACYSFCMCPGGQIVPTSTDPLELCVNGMSFSKRGSPWANSGLVATVTASDAAPFATAPGREALVGLDFQRHVERAAAAMGGGDLVVPVQTAPDFLAGRASDATSLPRSSYRLGVKPARLDRLYPRAITEAVKAALLAFDEQMPGFAGPEALLHAPEARTSSPVRVERDKNDRQSTVASGLFPAGEGAGYAGGIVSAAVDGLLAADEVVKYVEAEASVERA